MISHFGQRNALLSSSRWIITPSTTPIRSSHKPNVIGRAQPRRSSSNRIHRPHAATQRRLIVCETVTTSRQIAATRRKLERFNASRDSSRRLRRCDLKGNDSTHRRGAWDGSSVYCTDTPGGSNSVLMTRGVLSVIPLPFRLNSCEVAILLTAFELNRVMNFANALLHTCSTRLV